MEKECNGWSNYENWRVSLEFFSDYRFWMHDEGLTPEECDSRIEPEVLKDYVSGLLEGEADVGSTVFSYAMAFLDDVNWAEISAHLELDEENVI